MSDEQNANSLGSLFDPQAPLEISEHFRPHWSQAGVVVFITFRTADSIPAEVIRRWNRAKISWMQKHIGIQSNDWRSVLADLPAKQRSEFHKEFNRCREDFLDTCHGQCVLRRRELAEIVADSLLHFDGQRYRMGDFIVMPNHVHLLVSFPSEESLSVQCDSWLHYTARQINLKLGRKGKFWQQEPFDHLVRSEVQYDYLRRYIRDNGRKAGLVEDHYLYRKYEG